MLVSVNIYGLMDKTNKQNPKQINTLHYQKGSRITYSSFAPFADFMNIHFELIRWGSQTPFMTELITNYTSGWREPQHNTGPFVILIVVILKNSASVNSTTDALGGWMGSE